MKKRIVVVCPGRGSYTKETLGYLRDLNGPRRDFVLQIDQLRLNLGERSVSELDTLKNFDTNLHTRGEFASSLIYACAFTDFMAIDRERFEIVAVTGNSMGWYLALACGGSLNTASAFQLINTMGSMMKDFIIGGQIMTPICDDNWLPCDRRRANLESSVRRALAIEGSRIYKSIELGGYVILGANQTGLNALMKELPKEAQYPIRLLNHAAFHTPLLREISEVALKTIPCDIFRKPEVPLVDGRGVIWQPYSSEPEALWRYTLIDQIVEAYDFSCAIKVSLREFAPDHLVLLGPGSSLGAAIGQIMVEHRWKSLTHKEDFLRMQSKDPFLVAMGRAEQRGLVVKLEAETSPSQLPT